MVVLQKIVLVGAHPGSIMDEENEQLLDYTYLDTCEFGLADLGEQGLTPLRETSAYPEGVRTPMPDEQPDGAQLQDSFMALLDSVGSSALALPTAVDMDSPFAGMQLVIEKQNVHEVELHNEENRKYTVSNLQTFNVEVALINANKELARDVCVRLHASLLYENGNNVPNDKETILTGGTEVVIIGGRGLLKLKVGASVLTSRHNRQRFRVKISPNNEHLSAQFPQLTVHSEPFKSVTKLGSNRKPRSKPPHGDGGDGKVGEWTERAPPTEWHEIRGPHGEHGTHPVGIKGHGMGSRKRLADMDATQLNSCLSLPQWGPLGQPATRTAETGGRPALGLAPEGRAGGRTGRSLWAASVAAAPPVGNMGDEMMARLPVRLPRTSRQQAGTPVAAAPASAAQVTCIPAPMSAEEVRLRAELMWDRLLTWRATHRVPQPLVRGARTSLLRTTRASEAQGSTLTGAPRTVRLMCKVRPRHARKR